MCYYPIVRFINGKYPYLSMDFKEAEGYRNNNLNNKIRLNLSGIPDGQRKGLLAQFGNKIDEDVDYFPFKVELYGKVRVPFAIFELSLGLDDKTPIKDDNGLPIRIGNVWLEKVK